MQFLYTRSSINVFHTKTDLWTTRPPVWMHPRGLKPTPPPLIVDANIDVLILSPVVSGVHRYVRRLSAVYPGYVRRMSAGRWKSDATPDGPCDDVYSDDVVTEVKQNVWYYISVLAAAAAVLIIINYLCNECLVNTDTDGWRSKPKNLTFNTVM